MPAAPVVPDPLRHTAFRGSAALRAGLLTRNRLWSASWRRLFPDVYVHRDVPLSHELRTVAAAELLLPAAVVTGASAAVLWGVDLAGDDDDVELTLPAGSSPVRVRGLRVRRARLDDAWLWQRGGVPVTTPAATAADLAARLPTEDAVVAVDRLVHSGIVDLEPVRRLAAGLTGPGSARARRVCGLADGLAQSPQETRLRLVLDASGLPQPIAQYVVRNGAAFIARVDFGWPEQRVALEYDGLWHAEPGQFARDRARLNRLQAAGWRVVFVTAADLHRPAELLARVAAALAV